MNPRLARLHAYPFERLSRLTAGLTPPAALRGKVFLIVVKAKGLITGRGRIGARQRLHRLHG